MSAIFVDSAMVVVNVFVVVVVVVVVVFVVVVGQAGMLLTRFTI